MPLHVRLGGECDNPLRFESWQAQEIAKWFTPPLSTKQLAEEGMFQRYTLNTAQVKELFQYIPEADAHLELYRFQLVANRWVLVRFTDSSC